MMPVSRDNSAPWMLKVAPGLIANASVIYCELSRNSCCQAARTSGVSQPLPTWNVVEARTPSEVCSESAVALHRQVLDARARLRELVDGAGAGSRGRGTA